MRNRKHRFACTSVRLRSKLLTLIYLCTMQKPTCLKGILTDALPIASSQNHQPAPNRAPETPGPYCFAYTGALACKMMR